MEDCSSHGSTSFFTSRMPCELRIGVDNKTDGISSSAIKVEPLEYLNVKGAGSNTGGKSEPAPTKRKQKGKRYGRPKKSGELEDPKSALRKAKKEVDVMRERLSEVQNKMFVIFEYLKKELQQQRDANSAITKFLEEEVERLTDEVEELRDGATRSAEGIRSTLSDRRQLLRPPCYTRQIATDPHIIGIKSESFDKDRRECNFETFDKFSSMKHAASHTLSNGCANGADILKKLEVDDDSKVKLSDFADLGDEWIPVGKYSFPSSLYQIVQNITEVYGDVSATSRMNLTIAEGIYIMFCASIKEMSDLRLEQVTEDLILKWRDAIRDALRIDFKVDFAMEHLKKVTRAYIGLMQRRKLDNMASGFSNLEVQSSDEKAEHFEMSKEYMDAAEEFMGKAVSSGMF